MKARLLAALGLATTAACAGAGWRAPAPAPSPVSAPSPSGPPVAPASMAAAAVADASLRPDAAPRAEQADSGADVGASSELASSPAASPDAGGSSPSACNEQPPQEFLIRGHFLKAGPDGNLKAIQYRTDHYGYFRGFGHPGADAKPPSAFLVDAKFMGLSVKMHRKVAPALACVEAEIAGSCVGHPYKPHALAGIRYRNTYRGGEVTNHAYGIAIDVDPDINTCCGCVPPWNDAPACKRKAKTEYDRMAMPECWVHAFERYGFYWLGHDVLRDTMHFEFLGDPERIVRSESGP